GQVGEQQHADAEAVQLPASGADPGHAPDIDGQGRPLEGVVPERGSGVGLGRDPRRSADCRLRRWWDYCAAGASRTATDMIGRAGGWSPREPKNFLSEKLKMPPSSATMR